MNYTDLKAFIATELNRADLTASIPTFIALAEASINRQVRHRRMVVRADNTFDEQYLILPDDFLQAVNIQLNTDPPIALEYVTPQFADKLRAPGLTPGEPRYYTFIDGQIEAIPTPASNYVVEMAYYARLDPLTDANPTNWLLQDHPDVYLYGALKHSAPYLKNDERILVWDGLFRQAVSEINAESERGEISGATPIARTSIRW